MYGTKLRYLASIFLDAESIEPNAADLTALIRDFNDSQLLPAMVREGSSPKALPRIAFRSSNGERHLILRSNRFDYTYNSDENESVDIGDFASFCQDASSKFTVLLDHYQRKSRRLAAVQEGLLPHLPQLEMEAIASRLFHVPPLYEQHRPFEWDWRCAALVKREFGGLTEATNTIATIRRQPAVSVAIQQQTVEEEQVFFIRVDLDINTSPRDTALRFGANHMQDFFHQVVAWQKTFAESMGHFILGGDQQ